LKWLGGMWEAEKKSGICEYEFNDSVYNESRVKLFSCEVQV